MSKRELHFSVAYDIGQRRTPTTVRTCCRRDVDRRCLALVCSDKPTSTFQKTLVAPRERLAPHHSRANPHTKHARNLTRKTAGPHTTQPFPSLPGWRFSGLLKNPKFDECITLFRFSGVSVSPDPKFSSSSGLTVFGLVRRVPEKCVGRCVAHLGAAGAFLGPEKHKS